MANNIMQILRTSVSGRVANTTTLPNAGQLAMNMTDGIMYSTNGSVIFAIGANLVSSSVSNNINIGAFITANGSVGSAGQALLSGGASANAYWGSAGGGSSVGSAANTNVLFDDSGVANGSAIFVFNKSTNTVTIGNTTGNVTFGWNPTDISIAEFSGTQNAAIEIAVYNSSIGVNASADVVVNDTLGPTNLSNNYIDLGINGNTYSVSSWTINGPSDGYLYTGNTNLSIGAQTNNYVNFFVGGTLANNEVMRVSNVGVNIGNANTTTATLTIGNNTVNTYRTSTSLTIANSTLSTTYNANNILFGNSTVNTAITTTSMLINGAIVNPLGRQYLIGAGFALA